MKRIALAVAAVGLFALVATPALADDRVSARDIEAAVDTYLASAERDANLVGGPGSAGYDSGFWIRGGDFTLRINLTLQARFEYFKYDKDEKPRGIEVNDGQNTLPAGGDLSGFSLPRALIKFSGTAPCNIRYYVELDFGHNGGRILGVPIAAVGYLGSLTGPAMFTNWYQYSNTREAWIEWGMSDAFNFRMGQILYPNTRQLMVAPELQQFVDISMASSITGALQPGYTDRNRDFGAMVHGTFGCNNEWQYMVAIHNGDGGDSIRNVLNPLTSDTLMYSARLNWAFAEPIGYTEGATRFNSCVWYGELGIFGTYYRDAVDQPRTKIWNRLMAGIDFAAGYGGFSLTGAFNFFKLTNSDLFVWDEDWFITFVQAGYLFPDTAWEIAARFSYYQRKIKNTPGGDFSPKTSTIAGVVNYYLNGHGNKLQLDFTYIMASADDEVGAGWYDVYPGVPLGFNSDGNHFLVRFQWQLAL